MTKEIALPEGCKRIDVILRGSGEMPTAGVALVKEWTSVERQHRAILRTGKIVGTILACSLVGLFVHILLLFIIPLLLATIAGALPLYLRFAGEDSTWFKIEGECPNCREGKWLRPFIDTRYQADIEMVAQCPGCGQNARFKGAAQRSA